MPKRNSVPRVTIRMQDIPEMAQNVLIALRGQGETAYRAIADTAISLIDSGNFPAMGTYEVVAGLVGLRPRTVRDYVDTVRTVGDLLDEFAVFCRDHWGAMIPVARERAGEHRGDPQAVRDELTKLASEWLETSERYGGVIVPPAVMFAREKPQPTPAESFDAGLRSASSGHDRMAKATQSGYRLPAAVLAQLDVVGDAIGKLIEMLDAADASAAAAADAAGAALDAEHAAGATSGGLR